MRAKEAGHRLSTLQSNAEAELINRIHQAGVEKIDFMPLMFTPDDLHYMVRLRTAFNPDGRCSPGKMLPTAGGCAEPSSFVGQTKPGRRAAV